MRRPSKHRRLYKSKQSKAWQRTIEQLREDHPEYFHYDRRNQ